MTEAPTSASPVRFTANHFWKAMSVLCAIAIVKLLIPDSHLGPIVNPTRPHFSDQMHLAVLPVAGPERLAWLRRGLGEELIHVANRVADDSGRDLTVISALDYPATIEDARSFGHSQNVEAVMESALVSTSGEPEVAIRIIRIRDGEILWSFRLSEETGNNDQIRDAMATSLAEHLGLKARPGPLRGPATSTAWEFYLRARYAYHEQTSTALSIARGLYEDAIAADPDYADAYAGLAELMVLNAAHDDHVLDNTTQLAEAERYSQLALGLNPQNAEAHTVLGLIAARFHWNWLAAEAHFNQAIILDPNATNARVALALTHCYNQNTGQCQHWIEDARHYDPYNPLVRVAEAIAHYSAGRYAQASAQLEQLVTMYPSNPDIRLWFARALDATGAHAQARTEYQRTLQPGGNTRVKGELALTLAALGDKQALENIRIEIAALEDVRHIPGLVLAHIAMAEGNPELALANLHRALTENDPNLATILIDHRFLTLHTQPGFSVLRQRLGVTPITAADLPSEPPTTPR